MDTPAGRGPRQAVPHAVLLVGVLLVAAQPPRTDRRGRSDPPPIERDTGMSPSQMGILVATPSRHSRSALTVHSVAQRWGADRILFGAMVVLAGHPGPLPGKRLRRGVAAVVGTFVIGAAIAVGNVLLPVVVRCSARLSGPAPSGHGLLHRYAEIVAGLASGFVVPVNLSNGSWRIALAVWGTLILVTRVVATPRFV